MPKRFLLFSCLAILSALALSACGGGDSTTGGDSGGGSGDDAAAQVESVIVDSATSSDPADCAGLNTQAFIEQTTHESGNQALKSCEAQADESGSDSAEVSNVEVSGANATAEVALDGGTFNGQTLVIAVVKEDGEWKLDQITKIAKLDSGALEDTFRDELGASGELSDEQLDCIAGGIGKSSLPEVEELLLEGDSVAFVKLAQGCA